MSLLEVVLIVRLTARQLGRLIILGAFPAPRSYCSILIWDEDEIEQFAQELGDPEYAAFVAHLAGEP